MLGSFKRRRYPLLALAAILIAALVLLLIKGAYATGLLQPSTPEWEHGTTAPGSSVASLSNAVSNGETGVPGALGAGSGYQAINGRQTTGGHTTGGQTGSGQPTTGQPTDDPPIGGQGPGDQPTGGGTTGGQISEGVATPELPSSLLVVLGLILLLGVGWLNARRRDGLERK